MSDPALDVQFTLNRRTRRIQPAVKDVKPDQVRDVPISSAARALALAIYIEDAIARGEAKDYADIARLACLSRERVSQVLKLRFLAPELQSAVLTGQLALAEVDLRRIAGLYLWGEQICRSKDLPEKLIRSE